MADYDKALVARTANQVKIGVCNNCNQTGPAFGQLGNRNTIA